MSKLEALILEVGQNATAIKGTLTEALKPYAAHLGGQSVGQTVDEIVSAIQTALKSQGINLGGDVGAAPVTPKPEPEVAAKAAAKASSASQKPMKPFPEDHGVGCAKCGEGAPSVKFNVDGEGNESLVWTCEDGCGAVYQTLCRDA